MMRLFKKMMRMMKGSIRSAIDDGMRVDEGVTCMGGVNFGSEPYLIHLHRYCRLSYNVSFITHDGGTWAFRNSDPRYRDVVKFGTIEIGEYSFIGAKATLLPGISIGKNCVVAAGAVVTKSVPDGMVVAGVPAKIICTTEQYAEKCRQQMPSDFDYAAYQADKKNYLIKTMWKK